MAHEEKAEKRSRLFQSEGTEALKSHPFSRKGRRTLMEAYQSGRLRSWVTTKAFAQSFEADPVILLFRTLRPHAIEGVAE